MADAIAVGEGLGYLNAEVPDWRIPAIIAEPVSAGDYASSVPAVRAARRWVENAIKTNDSLPEIGALERSREPFENAATLEDLQDGADGAEEWALAADQVALAIETAAKPRDMLTTFGLWGVDIDPMLEEAKQAAIDGRIPIALGRSADVISTINNGASTGSLRLAGIIFFGVAVVGVAGLWLILRRQAGPSWARSTKPHWVEDDGKRRLLGRGKKKGK
jgi:hypothetical protein